MNNSVISLHPEPPQAARSINLDQIPAELRERDQWIVWKYVDAKPKPRKMPICPTSGRAASSTDSTTWASYAVANAALKSGRYEGLGYVFAEDDPFVGVDLDGCIENGEMKDWAATIVDQLNSYTEISPSGTGVHIIVAGTLPPNGRKRGSIEMYQSGRYFTVTGNHLPDTPLTVEARASELQSVHGGVFGSTTPQLAVVHPATNDPGTRADDDVLTSLKRDDRSGRFAKLWAGDWQSLGYPSQSEADLALTSMLFAACGGDTAQVDRLFRVSGLFRAKWDKRRGSQTYGERTIQTARSGGGAASPPAGDAQSLLAEINRRYALVRPGGKVRVLEELRDPSGSVRTVLFLTRADFGTLLTNIPTPVPKTTTASWWLSQPERREFERVDFLPNGSAPEIYNLWRGFSVKANAGDTQPFWDFVREVIADGDEGVLQYLRKYLAHLVQKPQDLPGVALVLRGGQGTGKNTFADTIGALVTDHYRTVTSMDKVTGHFNAHLKDILLLHANEAIWGGNKADAGNLKAMITDPKRMIEPKGVDAFEVSNFLRLIVSSNEEWAVPVDWDDRRFVVLDVSDCRKQDGEYFAALQKWRESGGLPALMHDLEQEDLSDFHPRNKPKARFGLDLKIRSAPSPVRWWYEVLVEGAFVGAFVEDHGFAIFESVILDEVSTTHCQKDMFYGSYIAWAQRVRENHPATKTSFFKALKSLVPGVEETRPAVEGKQARPRMWILPALGSCRASFEDKFQVPGQGPWNEASLT